MNDNYQTTDLNLAAVIISLTGLPLIGLNRSHPKKVTFLFERAEGLDEIIGAYWRRELQIEPLSLILAQQYLKDQIYSKQDFAS